MHGSHYVRSNLGMHPLPPMLGYAKVTAQQALGRGRAQEHHNLRLDYADFRLQPGSASIDLHCIGLFVNPALAPRLPFEMLDDVGHIYIFAVYPGRSQGLIKHHACRANKRLSLEIFLITWLLSNHHHARRCATFAKDRLCPEFPQGASLACGSSLTEFGKSRIDWDEQGGGG